MHSCVTLFHLNTTGQTERLKAKDDNILASTVRISFSLCLKLNRTKLEIFPQTLGMKSVAKMNADRQKM